MELLGGGALKITTGHPRIEMLGGECVAKMTTRRPYMELPGETWGGGEDDDTPLHRDAGRSAGDELGDVTSSRGAPESA